MTRTPLLIASLLLLLALTACSSGRKRSESPESATPWSTVETTVWSLERIQGNELLTDTEARLQFLSDGSLSGNGGVNNYRATYAREGEWGLTPSIVGSTRMYRDDPPGLMDQEGRYFELLGRVERFELRDGRLLLCKGEDVLLEFSAAE